MAKATLGKQRDGDDSHSPRWCRKKAWGTACIGLEKVDLERWWATPMLTQLGRCFHVIFPVAAHVSKRMKVLRGYRGISKGVASKEGL